MIIGSFAAPTRETTASETARYRTLVSRGQTAFLASMDEVEDGWSIRLQRQGKGPTSSER